MKPIVAAKQNLFVGEPTVISAAAPSSSRSVIFEDDGTTGYFYALDLADAERHIVDAVLIYEVEDVTDRHVPSEVLILWSADQQAAALVINQNPHAAFDFKSKCGYCRSNFPDPSGDSGWTRHGWADNLRERFNVKKADA